MNVNATSTKRLIIVLSIVVPVLVAILYLLPKNFSVGEEVYYLPMLNAFLNGTTSILLVAGFIAIKNGNKQIHKRIMLSALVLSVLFLLSYVTYHA